MWMKDTPALVLGISLTILEVHLGMPQMEILVPWTFTLNLSYPLPLLLAASPPAVSLMPLGACSLTLANH